jgi:NTE family protein
MAHIGLLKALEEHNIPIDYITGTSSGAVIGAMYASGYTPQEIEDFVKSDIFMKISEGKVEKNYDYYLSHEDLDASLISIHFAKDSLKHRLLPTNLIKSSLLDYQLMEMLSPTSNATNKDFDQLMIPFRCVASDVVKKKSVVFKNGDLNIAVRASMTFPFFINPIRVDGALLYDGGLYNNFPIDVMQNEFSPDFVIGSNVSSNEEPPHEDDLMSQVRTMLVFDSDYSVPKDSGLMINHELSIKTFDFDKVGQAIEEGYKNGLKMIDSLKMKIKRRTSEADLVLKRSILKARVTPIQVSDVRVTGVGKGAKYFVRKSILNQNKKESIDLETFKQRYFKLLNLAQIRYMLPTLEKISDTSYRVHIDVRKERDFKASFGGFLASRNVLAGFIGFNYDHISLLPVSIHTRGYFGKFYNSAHADLGIRLPIRFPLKITTYFDYHKVDYFESFFSFFNANQPSYVVQDEVNYGIKLGMTPYANAKMELDVASSMFFDRYYQEGNFTLADTADLSLYKFYSATFRYEHNTLNKKQNASAGQFIGVEASYISGWERATAGSSNSFTTYNNFHKYFRVKGTFQNHVLNKGVYRLGIRAEAMFSNQGFMHNYTSSSIASSGYSPTADGISHFLHDLRANQYFAFGLQNILTFKEKLDLRIEAHYFQPIKLLSKDENGLTTYNKPFADRGIIGSVSLIYHSLIGPLRFTAEYYTMKANPITLQLSFGFLIFNKRGIR